MSETTTTKPPKLRHWLAPPQFADDPEKTRSAKLLHILILAYLTLTIFVALALPIVKPPNASSIAVMIAFVLVLYGINYYALRQGYVRAVSYAVISFIIFVTLSAIAAAGSIQVMATAGTTLTIVLAGLLLSYRAIVAVTFINCAGLFAIYLAEQQGMLPEPTVLYEPISIGQWLMIAVILIINAIMLTLARQGIQGNFRRVEKQSKKLSQSNQALQELRDNLEALVAERTKNLEQANKDAHVAQTQMADQIWQTTGQAALADTMRGEQDPTALARTIIKDVCEYLETAVGAIYLTGEDGRLHLQGSYAFRQRQQLHNHFALGEGLVGQAALEREPILITNAQSNEMKIASGLGQAVPQQLFAVPLIYGDELLGVLKISKLDAFAERELAFLQSIAAGIATAFNTARARIRISELLASTQKQAAKLGNQEAELRANNEELEAQTEFLQKSEARLRQQQAQLESANAELEESSLALHEKQETLDQQNKALRQTQIALEERAEELTRANQYKSEFLANMSHELRTPLNSLLILSRMLSNNEEGNLNADQIESAQIIFNSGQDLLHLINEILDLSKIEAGRMEFQIAPMAFASMIQTLTQQFKPVAEERNLTFAIVQGDDMPATIATDQHRVEQIMKNLLSNAFKFTESGGVELRMERPFPSEEERLSACGLTPETAVAIRVKDSGIGMTPEQQAIVFEGFQQADGSTSRKYGGTGLGLTISRELATRLGGGIALESAVGEGSVFTLYCPVTAAVKETAVITKKRKEKEGRITAVKKDPLPTIQPIAPAISDDRDRLLNDRQLLLVIEDDINFARIIQDYAHKKGLQVIHADNGETGLQLAQTHLPAAIILDLRLPRLNGWEVLEQLKDNADTRHIPVHIISIDDKTIKALQMGAISFLSKPVSYENLESIFQNIGSFGERNIKNLLIIEDDASSRSAIRKLLSGEDISIAEAVNGQTALQLLGENQFDCMVLDLNLPDMSGFDVINKINDDKTIAKCPVIIYTGRELTEDENLELMKYADSVIIKGIKSLDRLLDETALFLHRVVADMPAGKQKAIKQLHQNKNNFEGKHVLIVDDDMRNTFALSKLLGEKGLKVTMASSGQKALDKLDKMADEIDLVLMDIMMPGMDGYEAIRQIRAQSRFQTLSILALTAKAMKGDAEKCIAAGANDYFSKPIDTDRLFSALRIWLYK